MNSISLGVARPHFGIDSAYAVHSRHGWMRMRGADLGNRSALSGGADQADHQVDNLASTLAGLSTAIADLRDKLNALTASSDPAAASGSDDNATTAGVSAYSAQLSSKQRGELQIHTQEGDVVTLKFSNALNVKYDSQQASDGTTSLSGEQLSMRSRTHVAVSVQGDLNDGELQAINDLVSKVGALTDEFYNGDIDSALTEVANLSYDTSQLADIALSLSLKQQFSAQSYVGLAAPASTTASEPAHTLPPTADATSDPNANATVTGVATDATGAVAPLADTTNVPATAAASSTASGEPAVTASTATGTAAQASGASATQTLADFVAKVRQSLRVSTTDASLGFSYDLKVRLLISSISAHPSGNQSPNDQSLETLAQQLSQVNAA